MEKTHEFKSRKQEIWVKGLGIKVLQVGIIYTIQIFGKKPKSCMLIKSTRKGYNFLDLEKNTCVLKTPLYIIKDRMNYDKPDELFFWVHESISINEEEHQKGYGHIGFQSIKDTLFDYVQVSKKINIFPKLGNIYIIKQGMLTKQKTIFIQTTEKTYNFLDLDTYECVIRNNLYNNNISKESLSFKIDGDISVQNSILNDIKK
jgi:hypothetical protein